MGTTFIVRVIFSVIQIIYSYKVSSNMAAYSSFKFFKKLMSLPIKFFDQHYIDDIMEHFDANKTLDYSLLKTVSLRFADVIMIAVYLTFWILLCITRYRK